VLVPGHERSAHANTGILLERAAPNVMDIAAASRHFGLTQREQQTVELLTLGLTSKEIASRMSISPNTVKAFFRLVMTKMAVSTRSGIVGKIARVQSLA
jgi:DNA-binding CsgD family transcriptional regulator